MRRDLAHRIVAQQAGIERHARQLRGIDRDPRHLRPGQVVADRDRHEGAAPPGLGDHLGDPLGRQRDQPAEPPAGSPPRSWPAPGSPGRDRSAGCGRAARRCGRGSRRATGGSRRWLMRFSSASSDVLVGARPPADSRAGRPAPRTRRAGRRRPAARGARSCAAAPPHDASIGLGIGAVRSAPSSSVDHRVERQRQRAAGRSSAGAANRRAPPQAGQQPAQRQRGAAPAAGSSTR